jgi:hypothetical protein
MTHKEIITVKFGKCCIQVALENKVSTINRRGTPNISLLLLGKQFRELDALASDSINWGVTDPFKTLKAMTTHLLPKFYLHGNNLHKISGCAQIPSHLSVDC